MGRDLSFQIIGNYRSNDSDSDNFQDLPRGMMISRHNSLLPDHVRLTKMELQREICSLALDLSRYFDNEIIPPDPIQGQEITEVIMIYSYISHLMDSQDKVDISYS